MRIPSMTNLITYVVASLSIIIGAGSLIIFTVFLYLGPFPMVELSLDVTASIGTRYWPVPCLYSSAHRNNSYTCQKEATTKKDFQGRILYFFRNHFIDTYCPVARITILDRFRGRFFPRVTASHFFCRRGGTNMDDGITDIGGSIRCTSLA